MSLETEVQRLREAHKTGFAAVHVLLKSSNGEVDRLEAEVSALRIEVAHLRGAAQARDADKGHVVEKWKATAPIWVAAVSGLFAVISGIVALFASTH